MVIKFKKTDPNAVIPVRKHSEDAGMDLCSCQHASILPGRSQLVQTGIAVAIPHKHVGYVCSRSGLAAKHGVFVLNAPGVVDCGYTAGIGVILMNAGKETFTVNPGDRIAQLVVQQIELPELLEVEDLGETERGENGFGSTDVSRKD